MFWIVVLSLLCSFSGSYAETTSTQEDVQSLISQLSLKRGTQRCLNRILKTTKSIGSVESRHQLYFELCRMLTYVRDIPFFSASTFLDKQSHLIQVAAKALKQAEWLTLADYPEDKRRPYIRFIFNTEKVIPPFPSSFNKQKPVAVFKAQPQRIREILTWELACLFGIEDAFTPAILLRLDGNRGELQIFQSNDLTLEQSYDENLYELVTYDSYLKSALGVLLFALEDIHNENCYFQFQKEGYLHIGMYDTAAAFCRTTFTPYSKNPSCPSLLTPYNWIGWDFPLINRKISKKCEHWLLQLIQSWPERVQAFQKYLTHPMTQDTLSKTEVDGMIKRSQRLHDLIRRDPRQPVRTWHEALIPSFPVMEEKLKEFIPNEKATWLLFRLHWFPESVYERISLHRRQEFKEWLHQFLATERSRSDLLGKAG